ncbi:hypothetical protein [Flavobacterium sp.]|uniref:hypothetical protein n=1 Tax=Flavobacterium sp. TaxID=239 RepID=UPI0025BF1238|nr:hypothetical protein [Flavobacterium sp.]MBA4155058.1 hypothetical protein [Flavobacterium sp.]
MSKTNHTPEPWKTKENFITSIDGLFISSLHGSGTLKSEDIANAKRIVECVNAMAGIESPQKLRETFEKVRYLKLDAYTEIKAERDNLQSWKNDAEFGHKLMMEAFKKQEEILSGLIQEYKEFIADCEVPPSITEFLSKAENLVKNNNSIKTEQA